MKKIIGLTNEEVLDRTKKDLVNKDLDIPTKSYKKIIFTNFFTLFNILNLFLGFLIFMVGSYKNLLFLGVVLCNTLISMLQEIRAKRIIDKLSVVASNKTNVIRDGKIISIENDKIVIDDIMLLKMGNQIVADATIIDGEVSVNESFITGESELLHKIKGDKLNSGSFITSGVCYARVIHVGESNYINVISKDAKYIKKANSIIINSINKIIKIISILIIPLGLILFLNQYHIDRNIENAIVNTVAALIGMIPEGLVLLTSTVLAVSTIRLARQNVLTKELYCIEMLARVDTICLDKTGTITTGDMKVKQVIPLSNCDIYEIMGNIVNKIDDDNATSKAMLKHFKKKSNYHFIEKIPFSSDKKYSEIIFEEGIFIMGAPEFIYDKEIKEVIENQSDRVLLVCRKDKTNIPICIIVLTDEIRKNAKSTLDYFKKEDVNVIIISGDNLKTVSNIARKAGLDNIRAVDVSNLSDKELEQVVLENNIFARVSPIQKVKIIKTLQNNKHFVAMAGDGVNDVLALKQADCSITIKSATEAARNVSQLVLLNDDFSSIPDIVKEGRRTINNIERSATLFLNKTTFATLLILIFMFVNFKYPFVPIQLTLTNLFTIGIPSFILALEPNDRRIKGNFLINVFSKTLPTAFTIVLNILIITLFSKILTLTSSQTSTLCVIMTGFTAFLLLFKICIPLNKFRTFLISFLILCFIGSVVGFREFFSLTLLNYKMLLFIYLLVIISTFLFGLMSILTDKLIEKYPKFFS